MKPVTSFFLFSATLSLTFFFHPSVAKGSTNLIQEVCTKTHNKVNCVASLESNPDSKQANLQQLGIIALNLASTNATNTSSYIKTTLLSNKTLGPVNEQALEDCSDQYLDAIQQLDDSLAALLANATNDVRAWVRAAVADVESCENGFKKQVPGQQMLLSSRNAVFRQLCNNVLVINKLLSRTSAGSN
ncbi:pectinesterase inhibitor-like [Populus nigra]|uniref:pectinesterase inhibitor-like n=1 Tax=Populus nigra TaxID=3691 RepID=UPI002B269B24|nr:pectinesterase inhibitor-like [Populus nigra]